MEGITRLTVDMPTEEHMYLKLAAASEKMSMKAFVLKATFAAMEELEDNFLPQVAVHAKTPNMCTRKSRSS